MNIRDLDECQGLSADMIRAYLERTGWRRATRDDIDPSRWTKGEHTTWLPLESEDLAVTIQGLSRVKGRTPQAILRDINPRLMPWPSDELIAAHGGPWLCLCQDDETACMGRFDGHWFKHSGNHVIEQRDRWARFWPCDAAGNKVRLPKVTK